MINESNIFLRNFEDKDILREQNFIFFLDQIAESPLNYVKSDIHNQIKNNLKKRLTNNSISFESLIHDDLNIKYDNINSIIENIGFLFNNILKGYKTIIQNNNFFINKNLNYSIINDYKKILISIKEKKIKNIYYFHNLKSNLFKHVEKNNNSEQSNSLLHKDIMLLPILKNYNSISPLFDLFLVNFKNVPYALEFKYNIIYFLRLFPLFKTIINNYFKNNDIETFKIIEDLKDNINLKEMFLPSLFGFKDNNFNIKNINNIMNTQIKYNNLFLNFPIIEESLIKTIKEVFSNFNIKEYGFNDYNENIRQIQLNQIYISNIDTFINKIENLLNNLLDPTDNLELTPEDRENLFLSNIICIDFNFYYKQNINFDNLNYNSLNVYMSKFFFRIYYIYKYFRLDQYKNYQELKNKFLIRLESLDPKNSSILHQLCYYILISFILNQNKILMDSISIEIKKLRIFFLLFNYFKSTTNMFELFLFLSISNKNFKFIYEYDHNENKLLYWLDQEYELLFKNNDKYIIKL